MRPEPFLLLQPAKTARRPMTLYLFQATHLPELANCWNFLRRSPDAPANLQFFFPEGLPWPFPDPPEFFTHYAVPPQPDALPAAAFFLIDPRRDPDPQFTHWAGNLQPAGLQPAKIITVVDCAAAESSAGLREYLRHALFFSDLVLLGNRAHASKSFVSSFRKEYRKACYPCRFSLLKGPGLSDKPFEILTPETRRLSQLFDPPEIPEESFSAAGFPLEVSWADEEEPPAAWMEMEEVFLEDESSPSESAANPPPPDVSSMVVTESSDSS